MLRAKVKRLYPCPAGSGRRSYYDVSLRFRIAPSMLMRALLLPCRWAVVLLFVVGSAPAAAQPEPLPAGSSMPDATLQTLDGETVQLSEQAGETGTVILFWSNQCPWIDRYEDRVAALADRFAGQDVSFLLVNANDATANAAESLESSQEWMSTRDLSATYVRDEGAALAHALGASRTPHVFVFDADETLVYSGTIDDSPSGAEGASNTYLADALDALVEDEEVPVTQTKAFGCTIKFPEAE